MFSSNAFLKKSWPVVMQCAQAHRKPRWLPVAKSKIYRIPKRPEISEEERAELKRLFNMYHTQMRAIKRFTYEDMVKEQATLQSASSEMSQRLEADEWERCVQINDRWNAQVAAEREERRKKALAEMEEYALQRMEAKDRQLQERIAKATQEIRKQKEQSATFITPETLDDAIERALANPIDYNFAINLQGERFTGREVPAPATKEKKAASN